MDETAQKSESVRPPESGSRIRPNYLSLGQYDVKLFLLPRSLEPLLLVLVKIRRLVDHKTRRHVFVLPSVCSQTRGEQLLCVIFRQMRAAIILVITGAASLDNQAFTAFIEYLCPRWS